MTALTTAKRWTKTGHCFPREGLVKILRGAKWESGYLIVAHRDRLMPYPTDGFDSNLTADNGGPLQIAGGDGNGGLRVIAKRDKISVEQVNGGAIAISVTPGATLKITITSVVGTSTANAVVAAIRAHGMVNELIDVVATGTGAGVTAAFAETVAPYVRIYGVAQGAAENTDASNDLTFDVNDKGRVIEGGEFGVEISAAVAPPGINFVLDNQTIQPFYKPLCLPIKVNRYLDESGQACCCL